MKNAVILLAAGVGLAVAVENASATETILFDTGTNYDANNGTSINTGDFHIESGIRFTNNTSEDLVLTKLEHRILYVSGTNAITLTVHDSVGGLPGNALETVEVTGLPENWSNPPVHTVNFSGSTTLQAGQEYFITAAGPAGSPGAGASTGGSFYWAHNVQGATGNVVLKFGVTGAWFNPGPDNITPAVRVFADVVPVCPGDLDGDGVVDVSDLLTLLSAWGACPGCEADLNGDGVVDVSDLLTLLGLWGPCS